MITTMDPSKSNADGEKETEMKSLETVVNIFHAAGNAFTRLGNLIVQINNEPVRNGRLSHQWKDEDVRKLRGSIFRFSEEIGQIMSNRASSVTDEMKKTLTEQLASASISTPNGELPSASISTLNGNSSVAETMDSRVGVKEMADSSAGEMMDSIEEVPGTSIVSSSVKRIQKVLPPRRAYIARKSKSIEEAPGTSTASSSVKKRIQKVLPPQRVYIARKSKSQQQQD